MLEAAIFLKKNEKRSTPVRQRDPKQRFLSLSVGDDEADDDDEDDDVERMMIKVLRL